MKALKKQREKLVSRLSDAAGLSPMIELHGSGEMMISGCRRVIDYDRDKIVAQTGMGIVEICGGELTMTVYRGDLLSVEGRIDMLCFKESETDA